MKRHKIFVLVKNFGGVNHDAEIYSSFKEAKREFRKYTGFRFNKHYSEPDCKKYNEKFSETKIFETALLDFLALKNDKSGGAHDKAKER